MRGARERTGGHLPDELAEPVGRASRAGAATRRAQRVRRIGEPAAQALAQKVVAVAHPDAGQHESGSREETAGLGQRAPDGPGVLQQPRHPGGHPRGEESKQVHGSPRDGRRLRSWPSTSSYGPPLAVQWHSCDKKVTHPRPRDLTGHVRDRADEAACAARSPVDGIETDSAGGSATRPTHQPVEIWRAECQGAGRCQQASPRVRRGATKGRPIRGPDG